MSINYEYCDKCGKINHVYTHETDPTSKQTVLDKFDELKRNNNLCDGNCQNRREDEDESDFENTLLNHWINEPAREYFAKNNIQFIELSSNGKYLMINAQKEDAVKNYIFSDLDVKVWLHNHQKKKIYYSDLDSSQNAPNNQPNTLNKQPWNPLTLIFGGLTVALVIFVIYWTFFKRGIGGRCRNCRSPKYSCDCPLIAK